MFADREEAGRALAAALARRALVDPVVVALPRGGVPVAAQVARRLNAPMDLLIVRKIGAPMQPELAVAAVAEGDPPAVEIDEETLAAVGEDERYVQDETPAHLAEIARRQRVYLRGAARVPLADRTVVLVDDGLATGTSARAAIKALRRSRPARIVLAVPVAPPQAVAQFSGIADEVVCLRQPSFFGGVGAHYADFHQVSDDEVTALLDEAAAGART